MIGYMFISDVTYIRICRVLKSIPQITQIRCLALQYTGMRLSELSILYMLAYICIYKPVTLCNYIVYTRTQ